MHVCTQYYNNNTINRESSKVTKYYFQDVKFTRNFT